MNSEAAIKATFRLLKSAAPCDFVNVCLRIVREEQRHASYRLIDSRGQEFAPALLKTFFREHPGMPMLMATPGFALSTPAKFCRPNRFCESHVSIAR